MDSFESVTLDHRRWVGSTNEELGTALAETSIIHRYTAANGQSFNILEVDGRKDQDGPVVVSAASFGSRIDPHLTERMGIYAHHTGSRIFVAETPGVTIDYDNPYNMRGAWQSPKQTLAASMGNFDPIAIAQLKGIDSIAHFEDGDKIELYGNSMGTYAAGAMVRVLEKNAFKKQIIVSKMTLVEPVNARPNNNILEHFKMVRNLVATEDTRRHLYLAENDFIGHPSVTIEDVFQDKRLYKHLKSQSAQNIATYAVGIGLRKNLYSTMHDVVANRNPDGTQLYNADITVARAFDSTVSLSKDLLALSAAARENGSYFRLLEFKAGKGDLTPLGHHTTDSLGRMSDFAIYMASRY